MAVVWAWLVWAQALWLLGSMVDWFGSISLVTSRGPFIKTNSVGLLCIGFFIVWFGLWIALGRLHLLGPCSKKRRGPTFYPAQPGSHWSLIQPDTVSAQIVSKSFSLGSTQFVGFPPVHFVSWLVHIGQFSAFLSWLN